MPRRRHNATRAGGSRVNTLSTIAAGATGGMSAAKWSEYMSAINTGIDIANQANTTYYRAKDFYRNATQGGRTTGTRSTSKKYTKQTPSRQKGIVNYGANYSKNIKTKGKKGWKGKLVIPTSSKKEARYKKIMPFGIMQKYFLTPYQNLDDENQTLSFPQDMLKLNPSVDSKHMACLVMNFSAADNHLDPNHYIIGKQRAPFQGATGDTNDKHSIIWENTSDNTALTPFTIPYQINKFPSSALGARYLRGLESGTQWPWIQPSTVLTGINLNLIFKASRPYDVILSCKLVRCTLPEPFNPGEWKTINSTAPGEVIQRELCNRAQFTSRLAFETIWTQAITLRGIKGGNQKIPTVTLKKFIKMQYLRSHMRRISTAGDQATIGSQSLPNSYQIEDGLFNNLYFVVTVKSKDDEYVATLNDKAGPPGSGGDGTETRGALRTIPPPTIAEEGYESESQCISCRIGGTISVYRKAKEVDTGISSSISELQNEVQQLKILAGINDDSDHEEEEKQIIKKELEN